MKLLVTGAQGFVGRHFCAAAAAAWPHAALRTPTLDVTDRDAVFAAMMAETPDVVVHLAAIAANAVAKSDPQRAWSVNLFGTINIADAILAAGGAARLLFVSSSEVYGASFTAGIPLDETALLQPQNLYAATKAAAEMALCALRPAGLRYVVMRPFNHIGPGQAEAFVVPAFAGQIARIEAGLSPPVLSVGNLAPARDFLDVRDVCAAYVAAIQHFEALAPGTILNVASGQGVRIQTLLDQLLAMNASKINVTVDPARLRGTEIDSAVGDASRARALLGWMPTQDLGDTLAQVLAYARKK